MTPPDDNHELPWGLHVIGVLLSLVVTVAMVLLAASTHGVARVLASAVASIGVAAAVLEVTNMSRWVLDRSS